MPSSRSRALFASAIAMLLTAGCSIPTAPSTSAPPVTEAPTGSSRPVGPAAVVDGVGHGWSHDAAGALAAASGAVSVTSEIATAGFITRDDLITSIASAGYASELSAVSSRQLDELSIELGQAGISPTQLVWAELPL